MGQLIQGGWMLFYEMGTQWPPESPEGPQSHVAMESLIVP